MEFLGVLAAIVLILTPILAISAFVRVQHLAEQLRTFPLPSLAARLSAIEQHLAALERSLASRGTATAPPAVERPAHAERSIVAPPFSLPLHTASRPPLPPREIPKPREVPLPPPQFNVFAAPPLHSSQTKSSSALDLETL